MRRLIAILVLLLARPALAQDSWSGEWPVAGDAKRVRTITASAGRLELAIELDGQQYRLSGDDARELRLAAEGPSPTRGLTGALAGEEARKGEPRKATLEARRDGDAVRARFALDGRTVLDETWRREPPGIEIVALEAGGKPLAGALDVPVARKLTVRFRVKGRPMSLVRRVEVAGGHPYASFYEPRGGVLVTQRLGQLPGEHVWEWDGRDDSPAARIALEGSYRIVIEEAVDEASGDGLPLPRARAVPRDERLLQVAAPRFVGVTSRWNLAPPEGGVYVRADGSVTPEKDWDRTKLVGVAGANLVGPRPASRQGWRLLTAIVEDPNGFEPAATAASLFISTHGSPGGLGFFDARDITRERPASDPLRFVSLRYYGLHVSRDLHFALLGSCNGATHEGTSPSVAESFIEDGADVVVAYETKVRSAEVADVHQLAIALIGLGAPVEKAARDAARAVFRHHHQAVDLSPSELEDRIASFRKNAEADGCPPATSLRVLRAPGISAAESAWPPRHGHSRNAATRAQTEAAR